MCVLLSITMVFAITHMGDEHSFYLMSRKLLSNCYSLNRNKNLVTKKSDKCDLCNHTRELHDIDEDGTYCYVCKRYEQLM